MKLNYGLRSSDKVIRKGFHSHLFKLNKKVLPIALVIMMAIQLVVPFYVLAQVNNNEPNKQVFVEGESYVVNSWEELKQIIEQGTYVDLDGTTRHVANQDNINIVINGPIAATTAIEIESNQTINLSGRNGAIIYGALNSENAQTVGSYKYKNMFYVDGGTFNIASSVTFSGQRAVYQNDTCEDVVPLNDTSNVSYISKNKYDFSNYDAISYTPSVAQEQYDYSNSSISYVPYVYPSVYDFTGFTTTYTPGSKGNEYKQFSYPNGADFEKYGIVSAHKMASDDTTAVCVDSTGVEWKMYFSRSPQKPYATSTSVSGVGDWIRVGSGEDDAGQTYYYFYATEFNKRIYIAADGTLARDWGSIFDGDKDGKIEYRWYPKNGGLEAQISVLNPKTGNYELETHYMHRDADTGALSFPTITSYNNATGLYVNGDTQVRTPENSPVVTGSWGRTYRVYPVTNYGGDLKNGPEVSDLTVGSLYHIQADNNKGWYTALAANSSGLTYKGSNNPDPNPDNTDYADTVWEYMADGTFRNRWWSDRNVNDKLTIYWDGSKIKATSWSNWQTLKVPHNSSLKLKNTEVFKPTDSTTGLALSGSPIMVLDSESLEEKSSLSNGDVVVLQSDGLYFFNKDEEWVDEPDDEANFKWTYNDGVLSNGNYKIFIEADGTNPRVVDDTDLGSDPISDSHLKANNKANNTEFELYKGDNTTVLNTTGPNYLTLYESNNGVPTTEASATLTNGAKYVIKSSDGYYLRGQGEGYTPGWNNDTTTMTWSRFDWTYNSSDGTLSHGNYKILVNIYGTVEIVDSTKNKVDGQDPVLKINNTPVYKGSILSTTSGDPVYLYKITGTSGSYGPGEEASSISDGPFYVKAGDQWLKKENNQDATWAVHPGNNRNYNTPVNPYVWEYDSKNKTLTHGDYAIYLDGTNGIVVDKNVKVGDIAFNGDIRYATTNSTTSLFTTNGTNSVYMYEVNNDGSKGNHVENGLVLDKYYYLVTEEDNKSLKADSNGGTWTDLTTQTEKNNEFAWKYISKIKDNKTYNVLYNEKTDQIIYHDGTKITMGENTTIHCETKLADRWKLVNKKNESDFNNWQHGTAAFNVDDGHSETQRGYFITAVNGSTINTEATFKDLWVHDNGSVKDIAPIVVNKSTFKMTGGSVKHNRVSYTANDNCSGMQAQGRNADSNKAGCNFNGVEDYIKRDNPGMTNTAGGIIFTNGAKGEITGNATIRENRGDAGGIIVQGVGTDVTLGAHIPDLNSDTQLDVVGGGHIDNNVGFHHAGAALVEDGAILRMASDSSTMNNNVTWAKGGAVWATEFGTADYAKIEYNNKKLSDASKVIKDAREEGVFIMVDGTIDNNTAFLRGGGINVESNKVYLIGGTISNNNSRVLGGGIYVEGDFPDYTYTLIINRGYVGHNYAVRYKPLDGSKPSTGGSWDNLTLTELNDRLDRRIGTSNYESITNQRISDESNTLNPDHNTALNDANIASGDGYPNRTADTKAYPMPHEGYGGGVWLCPIGGTAVFHMNADHEVIIDDNYASGKNNSDKTRGTDLYLHSGSGHMLVANTFTDGQELEKWINEATNEQIPENGPTYSGPLYLKNETPDNARYTYINNQGEEVTTTYVERKQAKVGIQIIDNISRDGGGIAANGTLLFGLPNDVYRGESELDFTKRWPADNDHINKVNFKMFYTLKYVKDGDSYYFVDGDGNVSSTATNPQPTDLIETDDTINNLPVYHELVEMPEYEFDLDGTNNSETTYDYSPETGSSTNPQNGEILWKAKTTIPTSVLLSGKTSYPMYRLKYKGETFEYNYTTSSTESSITVRQNEVINPATVIGMKKLYAIAHEKPNDSDLEIVDWNIVIKEYDEAGNEVTTAEFKSIAGRTVKVEKDEPIPFTVIDAGGLGKEVTPGYNINFSTLSFESEVKNGDGPSVEKYINNKVHQDLTTFEDVFEYEIMAYVPLDAEEIILYDTLQEPLMFVDSGYGGDYNAHPQYLDNGDVNPKFNGTIVQHQRWAMTGNNKENSGRHQIVVIDKNNHIGDGETGSVLSQGTDIVFKNGGPNPVSIGTLDTTTDVFTPGTLRENTGNTIYYVLNNETIENFESLRGKWVKVSFDAAIRPGYKDTEILKQKGWISDPENKKGSVNFISELEKTENVTVTKMFKNEAKGLYYALGEKENGDKKYYIYVSYSPDKIKNVENNVQPTAHEHGTEKNEFLAYEWYEVYQDGYGKYRLISDTLNYNNVNLWHAYYKVDKDSDGNITRGYEYEQDVTYDNVKNLLANNANATINKHNATYLNVYNYPVLNAANPHSGEKNQADYIVKYPHGAQSRYKTNIVTVDINLPEKYVNNKTHDILAAFDNTFEYEIMVYVPNDAKEIMIWDTLKDDLMFVDRFDNTQYKTYNVGTTSNPNGTDVLNDNFNKKNGYNESPMIANSATYGGYRLTYFKTNNHTGDGTGTVKNTGEPLNEPITKNQSDDNLYNDYIIVGDLITDTNGNVTGITPNNLGKSILIKIDESTNIQAVRGKWVKASFTAEIKPSRYDDIAKKISKDNMLTDDPALKDPNYPNPVGYYYRLEATTLYSENKKAGTSATENVHYLKDASGKFTDRQTTAYPRTRQDGSPTIEGVDYRLEYEADFLYFSKTKPEGIADTNLKPMYVRNGWNAADSTISWEFITDDGKVIDGEKLYDKTADEDKPIGVQQNGDHAGLANKANYAVKIGNEFKYTTTNTVTVVPKERDLEITKIWQVKGDTVLPSVQDFINNLELWWEYDDTNSGQHNKVTGNITNLYKNNIRIVFDKTEVTGESVRHEWKIIIDDLPKLSAEGNMHYFIKEKQPFTGYNLPEYSQEGHAHHNGRIKNGLIDNEGTTHLSVSKNWDDGISNQDHSETITVRLLGNGETIYQRNSENKIVDEDGNPITTSGNDPAEWEYSKKELNNTNSFEYEWDDLPRYQFDKDGKQVYIKYDYTLDEYHKALNGEKFILNGNRWEQSSYGTVLTKEQIKQIFLTTNVQEAAKYGANGEALSPIYLADIAYSIELLSDPEGYVLTEKSITNKRYTIKPKNYVYPTSGEPSEIIKAYLRIDYTVSPTKVYDRSSRIEASAEELEEINSNLAACKIDDVTELPETGSYDTLKVYECYIGVEEEYDTYEVDLINTKPQIEKYINKDVHHETYIGNDFEYDIIVYVPEEATEIEIFDELLPTLKLKALMEPNIVNDTIHGYNERSVASLPATAKMNVAVLSSNNHTVNGTVSNNKVDGTAEATIIIPTDNSNSFKLKIDNIYSIARSGDYIEYEHGEYFKVAPIEGGEAVYCKADEISADYRLENEKRYRIANQNYYSQDGSAELTDDSIVPVSRAKKYSDESMQFYKYMTLGEFKSIYSPTLGTVDGYLYNYESTSYTEIASPKDQAIGGKYVRVTFKAEFDLEKSEQLKAWINDVRSNFIDNKNLNWDVIKTESNQGWDGYIASLDYQKGRDEYVLASNVADGPVTELNYSLGKNKINKVIKNGDKYYGALDNAGNYYVYPMNLTTDSQYNNQWFRVVGNPIRYYTLLDSENPVKNGSTFDGNSDYWFAGNNSYIKPTIDSGTNLITNDTILVPVVENETYYKEVITGEPDKYYLDWVVEEYAGTKADSIKANGAYKKIDWGRGDGDIIRSNSENPSPYTRNHAGVVNTASYEVTYGNRYKSTHKSNTVTVVPQIYELPSSGGMGTFLFNILGVAFITMALCEIVLEIQKRKKSI